MLHGFPRMPSNVSRFQRFSLFRLSDAPTRCHCCLVAHDGFLRVCVLSEPASVQPFHTEFLEWSWSLVRFEEYLLSERGDLLFAWFSSHTLMRRHLVASDVECRQRPGCTSHGQVLDCLDGSLDAGRWSCLRRPLFIDGMYVPALSLTSMMLGSWSLCRFTF